MAEHDRGANVEARLEVENHQQMLSWQRIVMKKMSTSSGGNFGKSGFIGQDEAGHGRSTVGLTRAGGTTILLGPPDPYGLTGLVQTTHAYYFTVHAAY